MKDYQTFIFESYAWKPHSGTIELTYSLDDEISFTETLTLASAPFLKPEKAVEFDRALFALHLIGGISYFKTCLPKTIDVRSGTLNAQQAKFWNKVYENGLGEFFYKNNIDFHGLINFPSAPNVAPDPVLPPRKDWEKSRRILVPLGGGKDSVVTAEMLRGAGMEATLFRLGGHPLIDELAKVSGLPLLTVKRALAPELFELNSNGALNGHVPITAYLSCATIAISILYGYDAVVMSNERSANIGNVEFKGKEINHQWSKSLEFERAFQHYLIESVTRQVGYFSLLRPMSELKIAELFAQYPQYFGCTTSCNTNWRIVKDRPKELWCGACPKCAFVFALFAAVLPATRLVSMFGKNLFGDATLLPLYKELLGLEGFKPFECVGTPEETKAAFMMAHERGDLDDTVVMKMFISDVLPTIKNPKKLIADTMALDKEHAIPKEFLPLLSR